MGESSSALWFRSLRSLSLHLSILVGNGGCRFPLGTIYLLRHLYESSGEQLSFQLGCELCKCKDFFVSQIL
jgi:hypothetical protein